MSFCLIKLCASIDQFNYRPIVTVLNWCATADQPRFQTRVRPQSVPSFDTEFSTNLGPDPESSHGPSIHRKSCRRGQRHPSR